MQLCFAVQAILLRVATANDVSLVQMRLFGILRDHQPATLELARILNLDKSSVTGLIDRAERRGLVRRSVSPKDARVYHVSVTPFGRQLTAKVAAQVEREILALAAPLSDSERKHLAGIAERILPAPV